MRRIKFGNCQTCCRFFFYCRFRFFSLQFIIWAECYWIGNPLPPYPLTISLFYLPCQRLRLIYSSSFACGLDLLEIKPYSTMMTRGKRSSTATASSAQVKRPRGSSTSRPTKSKRPKQTSWVHSVPARSAAHERTFTRAGDQWAILSLQSCGPVFSCLSGYGFQHHECYFFGSTWKPEVCRDNPSRASTDIRPCCCCCTGVSSAGCSRPNWWGPHFKFYLHY